MGRRATPGKDAFAQGKPKQVALPRWFLTGWENLPHKGFPTWESIYALEQAGGVRSRDETTISICILSREGNNMAFGGMGPAESNLNGVSIVTIPLEVDFYFKSFLKGADEDIFQHLPEC
ncbi:hypothetical protein MHYP_G00119240 [Metynnis hypsauchen]